MFGFKIWYFWVLLGSKTLGIDGYLIYRGRGGLGLVFGVVVEFLGFFAFFQASNNAQGRERGLLLLMNSPKASIYREN